jgi:ribosomal protein S27E
MSHLDGNAAAGVLSEVFAHELTTAIATCAACGMTGPLGAVDLYEGPGTVLRCPSCEAVLARIAHIAGGTRVDLRGISVLRL